MLKKQRGGKRINAGRKPEGDAALKATIIARVTADQKRVFQEKGGGKWLRQTLTTAKSLTKNETEQEDKAIYRLCPLSFCPY